MFENIVFIVMVAVAIGAGIWVWWMECHGHSDETNSGDKAAKQGKTEKNSRKNG